MATERQKNRVHAFIAEVDEDIGRDCKVLQLAIDATLKEGAEFKYSTGYA